MVDPDFLLKNADFLWKNADFLWKNADFLIKQVFGTVLAMSSSPLAAKSWPAVFYLCGVLGYLYAAALVLAIPSDGGAATDSGHGRGQHQPFHCGTAVREVADEVGFLLRQKPMLAVIAAHVAHGYGWYVCQSWLPQYCEFQSKRHLFSIFH